MASMNFCEEGVHFCWLLSPYPPVTCPQNGHLVRQCCNLQAQTDYCMPCTYVQAAKSKRWSMNSI